MAAPTAAIGGAALNVFGGLRSASRAKAVGRYNQEAAEREADGLDIQAGQERAQASFDAERLKRRSDEILAQQRAAAASGGGSTSDATVAALRDEAVKVSSLDQLIVAAAGEERAQQLNHGANIKRAGGAFSAFEGREASRATLIGAGGSLLNSVANWKRTFG